MTASLPLGERACRCVSPQPTYSTHIDTGEAIATTVFCFGPCEAEADAIGARHPWRKWAP